MMLMHNHPMKRMRHILRLLVLLSLIYLTGCSGDFENGCVMAEDFGDIARSTTSVPSDYINDAGEATDGWFELKGVTLEPGQDILINIEGDVNLCTAAIDEQAMHYSASMAIPSDRTADFDGWIDTGIMLQEGDVLYTRIDSDSGWSDHENSGLCAANGWNFDTQCWSYEGRGLFGYIGNPSGISLRNEAAATRQSFPGTDKVSDTNTLSSLHSKNLEYFEFYDRECFAVMDSSLLVLPDGSDTSGDLTYIKPQGLVRFGAEVRVSQNSSVPSYYGTIMSTSNAVLLRASPGTSPK